MAVGRCLLVADDDDDDDLHCMLDVLGYVLGERVLDTVAIGIHDDRAKNDTLCKSVVIARASFIAAIDTLLRDADSHHSKGHWELMLPQKRSDSTSFWQQDFWTCIYENRHRTVAEVLRMRFDSIACEHPKQQHNIIDVLTVAILRIAYPSMSYRTLTPRVLHKRTCIATHNIVVAQMCARNDIEAALLIQFLDRHLYFAFGAV